MTPEQKRIAIAEICETAKHYKVGSRDGYECKWCGCSWERKKKACEYNPEIPDYLNDLNAMHEALKLLTPQQRIKFIHILGLDILQTCPLAGPYWMAQELDCYIILTATPSQLADAFLRVFGKLQ